MNRQFWIPVGIGILSALGIAGTTSAQLVSQASAPVVTQVSELPSLSLGEFQNKGLPNSIQNDRGVKVGGTFSDVFHNPKDEPNVFWATADRGPNGQIKVDGKNRRTFPVPEYNPSILKLKASGGKLEVLQQIPVLTQSGKPVTGLSNLDKVDETPWNWDATQTLPLNPNGLDVEGLVQAPDGSFWMAEEYSPSVLHIGADGKVLGRWVPQGRGLTGTDYPVQEVLPAVFNKRQRNRGLESLAISKDGKTLYTLIQSPMELPDGDTAKTSRMVRMVALDVAGSKTSGQYVYVMESVGSFTNGKEKDQNEMKISGVAYVNPTTLLVLERTDKRAKLYLVDLNGSTNLTGTAWDNPKASPSLESLQPDDLDSQTVKPVTKTLLADLGLMVGIPEKIEGLTIVDSQTLAVGNDNDFDLSSKGKGGFDDQGKLIPAKNGIRLISIKLPQALALE